MSHDSMVLTAWLIGVLLVGWCALKLLAYLWQVLLRMLGQASAAVRAPRALTEDEQGLIELGRLALAEMQQVQRAESRIDEHVTPRKSYRRRHQ